MEWSPGSQTHLSTKLLHRYPGRDTHVSICGWLEEKALRLTEESVMNHNLIHQKNTVHDQICYQSHDQQTSECRIRTSNLKEMNEQLIYFINIIIIQFRLSVSVFHEYYY